MTQKNNCHSTGILTITAVSKMTYYVSSGTLNPTHSLTHLQLQYV